MLAIFALLKANRTLGILRRKGKQKSPGTATGRSRSQPPTPEGREKISYCLYLMKYHQMKSGTSEIYFLAGRSEDVKKSSL